MNPSVTLLDLLPPHIADKLFYEPMTGCLLWKGAVSKGGRGGGYGSVRDRDESRQVHRVVWEIIKRKGKRLPRHITLDHVKARGCASTLCCNVDHLEPVSQGENNRRSTCWHHDAFRARHKRGRHADSEAA